MARVSRSWLFCVPLPYICKKMKTYAPLLLFLCFLWGCTNDKDTFYSLTVEIQPEEGGEVNYPTGPYKEGQQVSLEAVPKEGYVFAGWTGTVSGDANPLSLVMERDQKLIAHFERKTYALNVQVQGAGRVSEQVIRQGRLADVYPHGTLVRLTALPDSGWYFEKWEGAVSGSENPAEMVVDKPSEVTAVFQEDGPVDIVWLDSDKPLYVTELRTLHFKVVYKSGKEVTPDPLEFTIAKTRGVGEFRKEGNQLRVFRGGRTWISVNYGGFSKEFQTDIRGFEVVEDYDEFLKTPAEGASLVVPVVVINYLPTEDGINLDMNRAPDDYWQLQYSTLEEAKARINGELRITKFGIEEGTRYRQFARQERVDPYVGIKVVKYFNVYELQLRWDMTRLPYRRIDYHDLFAKLGMEDLVNNHGVKEVWINMFNKENFPSVVNSPYNDVATYYWIPESNMSSPVTGDISNSYREADDLPVYNHTYVVYGNSGHRGADTNLHNRGHQIEAQLRYIESLYNPNGEGGWLFWNHYVGNPVGSSQVKPSGRVGMTHFPPNAVEDYDYDNPNEVRSDIQDWAPLGGVFSMVNNQLWKSRQYDFNLTHTYYTRGNRHFKDYRNHAELKWLIYWWQTIPGPSNGLTYQGQPLTNWWDVFYNWDEVIQSSGDLVKRNNARKGEVKMQGNFPVCTHTGLKPLGR